MLLHLPSAVLRGRALCRGAAGSPPCLHACPLAARPSLQLSSLLLSSLPSRLSPRNRPPPPPPSPSPLLPPPPDDELLVRWRKVEAPFLHLPPADLQLTGWRDPFVFTANTAAAPSERWWWGWWGVQGRGGVDWAGAATAQCAGGAGWCGLFCLLPHMAAS